MALLTNLKKDMRMVNGHSRSRYSRENGFFIWFENKSPERFVKMKEAMPNPLQRREKVMKREAIVNNSPEKMDLRAMDVSADNRARLKALFPSVFAETQNEKGELVESIDFEKLKANTVKTFAARNRRRDKAEQILFRTV